MAQTYLNAGFSVVDGKSHRATEPARQPLSRTEMDVFETQVDSWNPFVITAPASETTRRFRCKMCCDLLCWWSGWLFYIKAVQCR